MRLFARFFRLIWGGDVDRPLRPVLAVSFVGSTCFSAGWSFVGIWAIRELGATKSQLGATFLIAALVGMVAGYLGGHVSDYVGRRPMILLGWALLGFAFLLFAFVGDRTYVGLALLVFSAIGGSVGGGADQAMVADLVPPERHEAAYASVRVASNLGVVCGPPIGGLLLDRRALADPLRRRRVDVRRRDRDRVAVPAASRRVRAGGAADPRVARR